MLVAFNNRLQLGALISFHLRIEDYLNRKTEEKDVLIHIIVAMDEDDVIIAACAAMIIAGSSVPVKRRKKRRQWVKSWLAERDRKGAYNNIIQELRFDDNISTLVNIAPS